MITRHFQVERSSLAYLHFILESYEGLAVMSTLDKASWTVAISCPDELATDLAALIGSLGTEIALREITEQDVHPYA